MTQKKKTKQNEKNKKRKTTTKKQKTKNPNETPRKIFKCPAELTSGKQKWTWNFFQQNIIFQHFLLPNLQNKVTFFKLSLTLLLFRFLSPHGLSLPLPHKNTNTTAMNSREPPKKNSHYSSEIYCYFCRSLLGS